MTTYEYPGVYIEEDASLALSVRTSATAIPVLLSKMKICLNQEMAIIVLIAG